MIAEPITFVGGRIDGRHCNSCKDGWAVCRVSVSGSCNHHRLRRAPASVVSCNVCSRGVERDDARLAPTDAEIEALVPGSLTQDEADAIIGVR